MHLFDMFANQLRHPHGVLNELKERFVLEGLSHDKHVAIFPSAANHVRDLCRRRKQKGRLPVFRDPLNQRLYVNARRSSNIKVTDHQIQCLFGRDVERLLAVKCRVDQYVPSFEGGADERKRQLVIVDDQDSSCLFLTHGFSL